MTELYDALIGLTHEQAREHLKDCTIRIVLMDGEPMVCTREVNMKRLNVHVFNGVITDIVGLG